MNYTHQPNIDETGEPPKPKPDISFQSIHEARTNFIIKNNRYPTFIITSPKDGEIFIELMHQKFGYVAIYNCMRFENMQLIRSDDIEDGKWILS